MQVRNSTIFITGGAGFIGSHIVDQLVLEKPKKIIVFDDFSRGVNKNLADHQSSQVVHIINGDVRNRDNVDVAMKGVDYVFHQAAIRITRCAGDPRACQEVMIDGTFNVLEASAKYGIKKIILASSAEVYGNPSYLPIDEKHPFNNTTAYGAAKIANEQMAKAFRAMYGLPYIVLRYFNVYGPRTDIDGDYKEVLVKWLDAIDAGKKPIIFGDGSQSLDFVYVEDVARANILALKSSLEEGLFNVGTGKMVTLKELLHVVLVLKKSTHTPVYEPAIKRPYVQKRCADTSLARKSLGFAATMSLRGGLSRLITWREEQKRLRKSV